MLNAAPDLLAVEIGRQCITINHRRGFLDSQIDPDPAVDLGVNAGGPADDLMGGPARHGVGAELEGAGRAAIGQVDGDDDGDAERDPKDAQQRLERAAQEIPQPGLEQAHARASGLRQLGGTSPRRAAMTFRIAV